MSLFRQVLGAELRGQRRAQGRRLVDVAAAAHISFTYLGEVERGEKEASSEFLSAICGALEAPLACVLRDVSDRMNVAPGLPSTPRPGATQPKGSPPQ